MTINANSNKTDTLAAYQRLKKEAKEKGVALPAEISSLTVKNTKSDLYTGYRRLEQLLSDAEEKAPRTKESAPEATQLSFVDKEQEKRAQTKPPEKAAEEPQAATFIKAPERSANSTAMTVTCQTEDDELKLLNAEIIEKIHALEEVKIMQREKLASLLALEQELGAFAAMLSKKREAAAVKQREREDRLAQNAEELAETARESDALLEKELAEAEAALAACREKLADSVKQRDLERKAEQERYAYEQSVLRKKEDDIWSDEAAKREAALKLLEAETEKLAQKVKEQEVTVPELEQQLTGLPALLEKAEADGAAQKQKELEEEYAHQDALAKKDAEAGISALEKQIEDLRADYEALLSEKETVQAKLDRAYDESNKLYLQTVQSTGGVKILGNAEKK